eukprot:439978_1
MDTSSDDSSTSSSDYSSSSDGSSDDDHVPMPYNYKHLSKHRKKEHLQIWLKTRQLLANEFRYNADTNDDAQNAFDQRLLEANTHNIWNVFGGFNGVLNVLIHNANQQQLTNLYNVLKQTRLNAPRVPVTSNHCDDGDGDRDAVDNARHDACSPYCGFKHLSVEINCIIDFLPRNSVRHFKTTSRKIGIVCLQEMNKIPVSVCNMNKFLDQEYKDMHLLSLRTRISSSRSPPNMTCSTLLDLWTKGYDIAQKQILIYKVSRHSGYYFGQLSLFKMPSRSKISVLEKRMNYVLFDTARITVITPLYISNLSVDNKIQVNDSDYRLIVLKYFDIINQRLDVIDFLLIDKKVSFSRVFEHTKHNKNERYSVFHHQLEEMNRFECVYHPKLSLYEENKSGVPPRPRHETSDDNVFEYLPGSQILVLQMNGAHPYIKDKARDAENTTFCKLYTDAVSFRRDYPKINATFQKIGDSSRTQSILVGRSWRFSLIRRNIAHKLGFDVNKTKYLELYKKDSVTQQYQIVYDNHNLFHGGHHFEYEWRLTDYDATQMVAGQGVYQLDVYVSNEHASGSDVMRYKPMKCGNSIWLRHDQSFVVKDFVNHLKNNDYLSNNAMAKYLPFVCANNNTLTSYSRCYTMNDTFVADGRGDMVVRLKLYIMQNAQINNMSDHNRNSNANKCLLKIRFTYDTMSSVPYYGSTDKLVGIPYIVSCIRDDDLQNVINATEDSDMYFDSWVRGNIQSCYLYRTAGGRGINLARKGGSYQHIPIYAAIMRYDMHQCLIIKLKKHLMIK